MRDNSNRVPAIITLVFLFFAVVGLAFFGALHKKSDRTYDTLTSNIQNSWVHDRQVYYYTGSFFARYDIASDNIDQLSSYLFIQNGITYPSWSSDSVVFRTNPRPTDRDDVTTAASQLGIKPATPHWWRYSFTTKQYQLLNFSDIDSCSSVTQLTDDELVCQTDKASDSGASKLSILTISTRSAQDIATTDDTISSITTKGNNVYFVITSLGGTQTLYTATDSSLSKKALYKATGDLSYYAYQDGSVLIRDTPKVAATNSDSDTAKTVVPAKQKVTLLKNGAAVTTKTFNVLPLSFYETGDQKPAMSSLDGTIWQVGDQGFNKLFKAIKTPFESGDLLFNIDSAGSYVLRDTGVLAASPRTHSPDYRQPSSFDIKEDNDPSGNWLIDAGTGGRRNAFLYLNSTSSSAQEQAVGDYLAKRGFRPSEFNLVWIVDGFEFSAPITPNAILVN